MQYRETLIISLFTVISSFSYNSTYCEELQTIKNIQPVKVIQIIDGDTMYADFNKNGIAEKDEKVRLNGIDTFEVKPTQFLEWQMKNYSLTQEEALGLGYLGKEFAKKHLLNKYVIVKYTGETERCDMGRRLVSLYYNNKNYEEEILKAGFATVYKQSNLAPQLQKYEDLEKIRKHAQKTHALNLVLLNKKNNKYHKPTCEYGLMASQVELVDLKDLKNNSQLQLVVI